MELINYGGPNWWIWYTSWKMLQSFFKQLKVINYIGWNIPLKQNKLVTLRFHTCDRDNRILWPFLSWVRFLYLLFSVGWNIYFLTWFSFTHKRKLRDSFYNPCMEFASQHWSDNLIRELCVQVPMFVYGNLICESRGDIRRRPNGNSHRQV